VNLRLRLAIALKYRHDEDTAPRVLASGQGRTADRMLALADEHDIPVHEDMALAEALSPVPVGETIPPELYAAIAEVLAMLVRMDAAMHRRLTGVTFARPS
jgi:flagellar biosynthesis protein